MTLDPMVTFHSSGRALEGSPLPLTPNRHSPEPYPIDALPPLMAAAAEAIAYHVQAPLALAGQCVLGAAAYLAQARINAPHHLRQEGMPCALFMLTLANSGDRKSECRRLAFREIDAKEQDTRTAYRQQLETIRFQADQLKGKKREEFLNANPVPADPRTQYSDATFEPIVGNMIRGASQAAWDTDEGGQLFGGSSLKAETRAATIGGLTKAFDSGFFERTRAKSNAEESGVAYHRRLSILMLAQPVTIAEALRDPLLLEQGFLARFLFCHAPSLAGSRMLTPERIAEKSYADGRLQPFWARCRDLMATPDAVDPETGEIRPPVVEMTEDATAVWLAFYNDTECEQAPLGEFAGIRPFASRAGELARRVAAVFACFEGLDTIDQATMASACRLVRFSLTEWTRYAEEDQPAIELVQADTLMTWLREPSRAAKWQTFHCNDLGKSGPKFVRNAKNRDRLLAILLESGHLLSEDGKQFRINPVAEVADSAESEEIPDIETAETVRNPAEPSGEALDLSVDKVSSAHFRITSAPKNPEDSRVSATSATSARSRPECAAPSYRGWI